MITIEIRQDGGSVKVDLSCSQKLNLSEAKHLVEVLSSTIKVAEDWQSAIRGPDFILNNLTFTEQKIGEKQ